ncbi:MAG: D-glycero-beta-D-manno-heptose 1-phosphate adenylyltransferase, partial [Fusobacteriaceae bacterium]
KRLKGPTRPINSELDRAEMLSGLKAVDFTIIFTEDTPMEIIDELKPSIHVKGGDYKKEDLPETVVVEKHGGEVRILNFVEGKSTTNIVNKINCK